MTNPLPIIGVASVILIGIGTFVGFTRKERKTQRQAQRRKTQQNNIQRWWSDSTNRQAKRRKTQQNNRKILPNMKRAKQITPPINSSLPPHVKPFTMNNPPPITFHIS